MTNFSDMSALPHDIVLCNFGGPTQASEVEPFLIKLFEDPFIIRSPFLNNYIRGKLARRIARKRAPKSTAEYEKIGFSPINRYTNYQAKRLEEQLRLTAPDTRVHVVNRYTAPFASEVIPQLRWGKARLFLLTMYPHTCHSTTVSSIRDFDLAFDALKGQRATDAIRIYSWWANPRYMAYSFAKLRDKLEETIKNSAMVNSTEKITILFSAHGLPVRYYNRGDPYVYETYAHFGELKRLGEQWLTAKFGASVQQRVQWHLSFQSRVGPVEWVKPYTDEMIRELAAQNQGQLLMVPISFTADHIETLYEMDITYQELAKASGFAGYQRVLAANEDNELAACLADVLKQNGFPS